MDYGTSYLRSGAAQFRLPETNASHSVDIAIVCVSFLCTSELKGHAFKWCL